MFRSFSLRLVAIAGSFAFLSGCGGSAGGSAPSLPAAQSPTSAGKSAVRFSVVVPKSTASTGRSPAYVSPATQSMTISVLQGATPVLSESVGLTASSTGCTSSLASTTCTLQLSLAAGAYTASITTYDGPNGTGNALSTAQSVAFTVVANQNNVVSLTLSGIPTSIVVLSAGSDAVDVLAKDADGNFIVGAGAPTFTASQGSGPAVAAITQPSTSAPNRIAFAAASPVVDGTESINITASYPTGESNACTQSGAVCSLPSAVTVTQRGGTAMLANYSDGNVLGYSLPLTSSTQAPAETIPLGNAFLLTEDASGNVFAASYSNPATVIEIPPPYTNAVVTNSLGGNNPYQIAVAPNGDLALANTSGSPGSLYPSPFSATAAPTAISASGLSTPYGVAFDASNNLYLGNQGSADVVMFAPPYSGTPVTVKTTALPYSLTISGNTLVVGESTAIDVFSLPLTGASTPAATLTNGVSYVYGTALDASGNLWVANDGGGAKSEGSIEEFTKPFTTGEAPAVSISMPVGGGSTSYDPWGIGFDTSGNLYVTNVYGGGYDGGLLEFSPPITSSSTPAVAIEGTNLYDAYDLVITPPNFSVTP